MIQLIQVMWKICLIGSAFIMTACGGTHIQPPTEKKSAVRKVSVQSARQEQVHLPVHATGRIFPKREIKLGFPIGGIVEKILAKAGQNVRNGQLLAQLDAGELTAREEQARLQLDQRTRALERAQNLFEDSVITREQLEQAEAGLANAEAELNVANWYQSRTRLYAPSSGLILKRLAESSEQVGPGQALYVFSASQNAWVARVHVSGNDLPRLSIGDSASVQLSAYPDTSLSSYIEEISQIADPYTGTYEIDLALKSSRHMPIVSGFLASADLFSAKQTSAWLIPVDGLHVSPSGRQYVWTITDGKTAQRFLDIERIYQDQVIVRSGIETAIPVIVSDAQQLQSGQQVQIIAPSR